MKTFWRIHPSWEVRARMAAEDVLKRHKVKNKPAHFRDVRHN